MSSSTSNTRRILLTICVFLPVAESRGGAQAWPSASLAQFFRDLVGHFLGGLLHLAHGLIPPALGAQLAARNDKK